MAECSITMEIILEKEEELKLEKMKMKMLNNLYEIATDCKFRSQKNSILSDHENVVLIYTQYF